jgi:cell division protein FtsW
MGKKYTAYIIIVTAILFISGLVMLSSASAVKSFEFVGNNYHFFLQQLMKGAIPGIIALIITANIDYRNWKKFAPVLLIATLLLLIAVFIPGIGYEIKGARRWIGLGPLSVQPTEIIKLTFLIYLATWLDKRNKGIKDFQTGFLPFVVIIAVIGFLIMLQPDLGTMSVIIVSAIVAYFIAGAPLKYLAILGASGLTLIFILIKAAPYRLARFTVFLNPEQDPSGIGYQINQALLAIGSGGILGRGLGKSLQKHNYLPEATGDSIFAIMAEELGFIRILFFIALFAFFAISGYMISKYARDDFGRVLAAGITSWIGFQAFVNIAAMLSLLPLTGIPLPFISYGGTALLVSLAAVGILINIGRQSRV